MTIHWQKLIRRIKCGRVCSIKCFVVVLLFSAASCKGASNKNVGDTSQSELLQSKLPKDFSAVGLVYHRFGDNRYPSTNTPLANFEEQLKYLTQNGFKTFTVTDLYRNRDVDRKNIFITVDDGLKSFYTHGWPLLQKYNCKATLFVNTESVGWGDYLTWAQLRELAKGGVEIGSHSHKHTYFLNEAEDKRVQIFTGDLDISEQLFRDSLGFVPKVYAYPYGEFDEQMAEVLKRRGYTLAFAQNSGVWGSATHPFAIPRFPVAGNFVHLESFKQKVNMKPLLVKENSMFPIEMEANEPLSLQLLLNSAQNVHGLNCFFNNKPNSSIYKLNKDTITVQFAMPANARRVLLTFTAKNKDNEWCWWSKLLVNKTEND